MTLPISVIIPHRNQNRWLAKAVQSARDAEASEVFVFDDNSDVYPTDVAESTTVISQIHPCRVGVCYARNTLLSYCRHDLIFALDADDRLYPDALQRLYDAWQPGTWVYADTYTEIDEGENVIGEQHHPPPGLIHRKNLTYASFLFHRDDWHKAGGYDPTFEFGDEDYAFQVALTAVGAKPVRIEGAPLYKRMIHQHSRTANAVKYFPMVLEMLRVKYPSVMHP